MNPLLVGRTATSKVMDDQDEKTLLAKGKSITDAMLNSIPLSKWREISVSGGEEIEEQLSEFFETLEDQEDLVKMMYEQKVTKLKKGDELPPGVIKMVKV